MDSYEKKYKEALERARQLCAYPTTKPFISDLQDLFPELCESEDERIRKALITYFSDEDESYDGIPYPNIRAWLEKQGEIIKEWGDLKFQYIQNDLQEMVDLKQKTEQGEQKPNPCDGCINRKGCINCENGELRETEHKPANKVEPKFKIGDTIIDPTDSTFTFHINAIKDGKYIESDKDWVLIKEADNDYELVERKPAWSEDDEAMWAEVSDLLWEGYKQSDSRFSWDDIRNWVNPKLKSLKDRVQPQPKQDGVMNEH